MKVRRLSLAAIWHPLAFAAWPVVNLYRVNIAETPFREALASTLLCMAVAGIVLNVFMLVVRDVRRSALMTSIAMLALMMWGPVRDSTGDPGWLFFVWVGVAVVLVLLLAFAGGVARELTIVAAAVATVVLLLALVPVVQAKLPDFRAARRAVPPQENIDQQVGDWAAPGEPRDIFYLVFDRYGAQASMEDRWSMELDPFFDQLQSRGFVVTPDSKANHLRTAQSLSSTFNMRYHQPLAEQYGPDTGNMLPIYELLENHLVGRMLKERGYEYVHIGAWWDPTQSSRNADQNWSYERWKDFSLELFRSTLLSRFEHRLSGRPRSEELRHGPYNGALEQFRSLRLAAARPGPTFTFAHVLLPHEPFVFDRHGNYITLDEDIARGRDLNYREQTLFTNELILRFLDDVLDVPAEERPIIVVAADEGPHPVRFKADEENFDWTQATDEELREKFAILNAYYLPDPPGDPGLYDTISPVNTWRVLFNTYFGGEVPLLEDRSYVFRDENHVYDFTEVTDRLRGQ
jgi:hypothetical protein